MKSLKTKFPGLEFDEPTHTYKVDGEVYPSVSSLISNFYKPFDFEGVAQGYARKHGFAVEEVMQAWRGENLESTDKGTAVHLFGENYAKHRYFGIGDKPTVPNKQALGIIQYYSDLPDYIEVVDLELQMYSKKYAYCGTADHVFYNHKHDYFIISDTKTNKSLTSDYNTDPVFHLPTELGVLQDNYGKYTIQLGFYQILLEEAGVDVGSRVLVWLQEQEDKKLYKAYKTKDVTRYLRSWLEERNY